MKKSLGQNFLTDKNYHRKILAAMNMGPADVIIEIGPGMGALTQELLPRALHYVAIELDDRFAENLLQMYGADSKFDLLHQDILTVDIETLIEDLKERFPQRSSITVFGNIPYNITTPIMVMLAEHATWDKAFLTVQKEYADRAVASPGSKTYGSITVFLSYFMALTREFVIPAACFFPPPKVDSAFLSMYPHHEPPVTVADRDLLFRVTRTAFSKRRKTIYNTLKYLDIEGLDHQKLFNTLTECGINTKLRPEQLSLNDFAHITNALHHTIKG